MSKKVLLATVKPFSPDARDQVCGILKDSGFEVAVLEKYDGQGALHEAVADADALIVRSDIIDAEVLAAAKQLKLVVRAGAGYDNIDCAGAKERGVVVMNTPGQNANAVGELGLGLLIYVARTRFSGKPGTELRGKRLGLHAMGATGRALAQAARGLGMEVSAYDPYVSETAMREAGVTPVASAEELYRGNDYVSLHMPANAETKGAIGTKLLSLLPKNGCLLNTARAELINEPELVAVLGERSDLRYITDIAPTAETKQVLEEKHAGQVYWTPKKMGAQTKEANLNAGLAAARQIAGFFLRDERNFVVNP